ncbi:MAG: hypothetical protein ABIR33_06105 [Pyrinomonadaceae bacterium]
MNTNSPYFPFTITLGLLISVVLGCGGGKPVPQQYHGNWEASFGGQVHSTIYMRPDGKAGFKIPGKEVDGGGAVIDENARTLTISLMGISHTWKIVEPPNANGEMTLGDTSDLGPMGKLEGKTVFRRK